MFNNNTITIDDVNVLLRNKYYDSSRKRVTCIIQSGENIESSNAIVYDPSVLDKMTTFDFIYFFTRLLFIRIDLYSLFYKSSNYGYFVFDETGMLSPQMYNKMVVAYCYYDDVNKKYVIPDTNVFNKKYLFKYFDINNFCINDNIKFTSCYSEKNKNVNSFIVFLQIYCKSLNKIYCNIKYKISL